MSQTAHRPLEASKDAHEAWSKASCAVLEDLKHENVLAYVWLFFMTFIRHWGAYSRIKEKKGNDSHLILFATNQYRFHEKTAISSVLVPGATRH